MYSFRIRVASSSHHQQAGRLDFDSIGALMIILLTKQAKASVYQKYGTWLSAFYFRELPTYPMSLYYDAAPLLKSSDELTGSLKSRVFTSKDIKSSPKQVYALVSEASKWSSILTEVIEKSQLLHFERKVCKRSPWLSRKCTD